MDPVLSAFRPSQPIAAHEQIADHLRQQILGGTLAPGARLPTTQELARQWAVTVTTIQTALAPLVKEGLLRRRPRVGTIVCEPAAAAKRIGLYRPSDPARESRDHYARRVAGVIAAKLGETGIATTYFTDFRPEAEQVTPPPELLHAVRTRQLDAVIATECNRRVAPWLAQLPIPTAASGSDRGTTEVTEDQGQFARDGVADLVARGCRSIGLISALTADQTYDDGTPHVHRELYDSFLTSVAAAGIVTRPEWIHTPPPGHTILEPDAERFGYDGVRRVYAGPERPDGLLVFSDVVARGVIMGLLTLMADGAPAPRLVLHRNSAIGLFSPLPADFLENSIDSVADALLAHIAAQREGRPTTFTKLPYRLIRGA